MMLLPDQKAGHRQPQATMRWLDQHWGGVILATTVALTASFLAEHYGAPAMLFALFLGIAFNFQNDSAMAGPGIAFCSTPFLRVAMLPLVLLVVSLVFRKDAALWACRSSSSLSSC